MDTPQRNLTGEEISRFKSDGVVFARGLFSDAWLSRMAAATDAAVAAPTPMGAGVSMPKENFAGDLFLWKANDDFRDWIYDSPAAFLAGQVLGTERIRHFYDQLFVKPAGCHVATPWHQDITFWPVDIENRNFCSIWITFDPVSRESSGLEFVRGSHRWPERFKATTPNYDPYMLDSNFADPPNVDARREEYDIFSVDLEAGDCLIFDAHILHGSTGNYSTDMPRRAFATRWFKGDVRYDPRHATMPLLWTHGLEAGDPLGGPLFPQILPHSIESEGSERSRGPEMPDPKLVERFLEAVGSVPIHDHARV